MTKKLEAFCLASGPSLTAEDVEIVREWRDRTGGFVVVTNTTFRLAPWADWLFAMDEKWWLEYLEEVRQVFKGRLVTNNNRATFIGVEHPAQFLGIFDAFGNSGCGAISLASRLGAETIYLLGYDCSIEDGAHWHGDHPDTLNNCQSVGKWHKQFEVMAYRMRKNNIINASRKSALSMFPRLPLESVTQPRCLS